MKNEKLRHCKKIRGLKNSGGYWVRQEAVVSGPPVLKIPHIVSFCCIYFFLEITMKLGRKVGNPRSIQSEDFFFHARFWEKNTENPRSIRSEDFFFVLEITMILGEK